MVGGWRGWVDGWEGESGTEEEAVSEEGDVGRRKESFREGEGEGRKRGGDGGGGQRKEGKTEGRGRWEEKGEGEGRTGAGRKWQEGECGEGGVGGGRERVGEIIISTKQSTMEHWEH